MKPDILRRAGIIPEDPGAHRVLLSRTGNLGRDEARLVAEIDRRYFLKSAGQRGDTFKVIDHEIVFLYRQIADLPVDAKRRQYLPRDLPVIEPAAMGIEQAQPLAPVSDRSVQIKAVVRTAQEDIDLAMPLQVGE